MVVESDWRLSITHKDSYNFFRSLFEIIKFSIPNRSSLLSTNDTDSTENSCQRRAYVHCSIVRIRPTHIIESVDIIIVVVISVTAASWHNHFHGQMLSGISLRSQLQIPPGMTGRWNNLLVKHQVDLISLAPPSQICRTSAKI